MVVFAVIILTLVAPANAQSVRARESHTPPVTRAEELYQRAVALYDKPSQFREAAQLLIASARLRSPDDPAAFTSLWMAGRLYSAARDRRNAQRTLEEAARLALGNGEVVEAANAFLDAAFIAVDRRDDGALELVVLAQRLATSSHLQNGQREAILKRIGPARVAAADMARK
jgi:hypothetical protein